MPSPNLVSARQAGCFAEIGCNHHPHIRSRTRGPCCPQRWLLGYMIHSSGRQVRSGWSTGPRRRLNTRLWHNRCRHSCPTIQSRRRCRCHPRPSHWQRLRRSPAHRSGWSRPARRCSNRLPSRNRDDCCHRHPMFPSRILCHSCPRQWHRRNHRRSRVVIEVGPERHTANAISSRWERGQPS
jgi:hypothetical protein